MPELFAPTLQDEIACVEREVKMREQVYPRLVARGSMKQDTADRELVLMKAVLVTLKGLHNEDAPPDPFDG